MKAGLPRTLVQLLVQFWRGAGGVEGGPATGGGGWVDPRKFFSKGGAR